LKFVKNSALMWRKIALFNPKVTIHHPTYEQNGEPEGRQTALLAGSANLCGGILNRQTDCLKTDYPAEAMGSRGDACTRLLPFGLISGVSQADRR
jgi:hypothetical protein